MRKKFVTVFLSTSFSIIKNVLEYRLWRCVNWRGSYADFYVWQVSNKLDKGETHKSLGKHFIASDDSLDHTKDADGLEVDRYNQAESGVGVLRNLIELGLKPEHKVVEYGCGSLRAGRHFIDYLLSDNYHGLDISDRFYRDGLNMLGTGVVQKKRPECSVISPDSLATTAKVKPDFIFAVAVTQHVAPGELEKYIQSIFSMMSENTTLALYFVESSRQSRVKGKSWVYTREKMLKLAHTHSSDRSFEVRKAGSKRTSIRVDAWHSFLYSKQIT